ncbi:hypothetical protein AB0399_20560 [Streptomyces sp. NPDC088194]|uniref:DUF6907 domain-containing protein n=1 Tax=Streptomyces sp. NPDC088194 TaxID=3154931 RepID=UPI00344E7BC3
MPATDQPRTWTITTDTGFSISGHLPPWATDDPSEHQLPVDRLGIALSDINHHQEIHGQTLPLRTPDPCHPDAQSVTVFRGSIDCDPYATEPDLRVPVFNFHLVDDYRLEALGPDDITELATTFRAHADLLDHHVRPALIQARRDWQLHSTLPRAAAGPHPSER